MTKALNITTLALAILMLGVLTLLSIRGIIDPASSAASFGVPVSDPDAALYQVVYRARNLVISITGLLFLAFGMWRALAILTTAAIVLPASDIFFLKAAGIPVLAVHPGTLVALVVLSVLLWLRVRAADRDLAVA
jgi:hypothetical protein